MTTLKVIREWEGSFKTASQRTLSSKSLHKVMSNVCEMVLCKQKGFVQCDGQGWAR